MDPNQAGMRMEPAEGEKKKKKTRSKPGRHQKIKARVELRVKWEAEKKNCERKGLKVFDKNSPYFAAFQHLEQNFPLKTALPDAQPPKLSERAFFKNLSRKTVSLLRSKLPTSGIAYSSLDGSVCLEDIAKYLHVSPDAIATAALPEEDGKRGLLIFELITNGHQERRIAALGGHSFPVYSPLGNWPISPKGAECIESLVHETDKAHLIKRSGFISSMARFGGVNFTIAKRGGYRNKADCLVSLNSKSLSSAIMDGFEFFENRFSGIVYGAGKWNSEKQQWAGKIPLNYLSFSGI